MGKRGWSKEDGVQLPQGAACRPDSLADGVSRFHLHLPSVKGSPHGDAQWLFPGQLAGRRARGDLCGSRAHPDPGGAGGGGWGENPHKMKPAPSVTWTRMFETSPRSRNPFANDKNRIPKKPVHPLNGDFCRNPHISEALVTGSLSKGHPL